jgi:hypothetical protein
MRWSDEDGFVNESIIWNGVPSPPLARNLPCPEENVRAFTHEL